MSHKERGAPAAEELHVYDDGPGAPGPQLPNQFDWVELTAKEASRYQQLRILRGDLDFVIALVSRLLDRWPSEGAASEDRDLERDEHRAMWNAAIVAYARPFKTGIGERLDASIFNGKAAQMHEFFIGLRDRHVAHSVSEYEEVGVVIALDRDDSGAVEGLLDFYRTEQSPGKRRAEELLNLARLGVALLEGRLEAERARLLEYARKNSGQISTRRRLTHVAPPSYDDSVKKRKVR